MQASASRGQKRRVKTILFSARSDSFYVNMNPIAKFLLLILLSVGVVESIIRPVPDLTYNLLVLVFALGFLFESGTIKYLVKSYLALLVVALFVMMAWWIVFNQIGTNPIFSMTLFGATLRITYLSIYVGIGKISGYASMAFMTLLTIMSTRDADIISALKRLRAPFKAVFFASLIARSLNIMSDDLDSIRQAQFARGAGGASTNIIKKVSAFVMLSIPLTTSMIKRSVDMGFALESRGFSKSKGLSDFISEKRFKASDAAIVAFGAFMLMLPFI
jgi:biotin transport system permease protein/energy-coupling factor transport system permease protein